MGRVGYQGHSEDCCFLFFLFRSRSHDIILNSNLSGLHSYPFISFSVMCGRLVMPSLKPVVI